MTWSPHHRRLSSLPFRCTPPQNEFSAGRLFPQPGEGSFLILRQPVLVVVADRADDSFCMCSCGVHDGGRPSGSIQACCLLLFFFSFSLYLTDYPPLKLNRSLFLEAPCQASFYLSPFPPQGAGIYDRKVFGSATACVPPYFFFSPSQTSIETRPVLLAGSGSTGPPRVLSLRSPSRTDSNW